MRESSASPLGPIKKRGDYSIERMSAKKDQRPENVHTLSVKRCSQLNASKKARKREREGGLG